MDNWHRLENETDEELIYRICSNKDIIGTWQDVADVINRLIDSNHTESAYRKKFHASGKSLNIDCSSSVSEDEKIDELRLQKQEIKKERRKLLDERLDINRRLRDEARLETTIEKIEEALTSIGAEKYVAYSPVRTVGNRDMIIMLSDLHIGADFSGFSGCYNSDVAKERLSAYLSKAIEIQKTHKVQNCVVVLLGDIISGNIHHTISVTNKEDVIEQVKLSCQYISDFIYELGRQFKSVEVHGVNGNHSRIDKKEDALLGERLDALVLWFVKTMLKANTNITVMDDDIDDTVTTFFLRDKLYFGVHGDWDATTNAGIAKLALWAKVTPYCVLCGHKHFPAMTDVSGIKVVQSGSLCGAGDEYTRQKRLTGEASQTILVVTDNGIECCYPVTLS